MRVPRAVALSAAVAVVLVPAVAPETRGDEKPLRGFSAQSSAAQRALETRFDAQLNASNLRAWLKEGGAIPEDSKLAAELVAPKYEFDDRQRRKVESKDAMKKRLKRSPDRADALALAVWEPSAYLPADEEQEELGAVLTGHDDPYSGVDPGAGFDPYAGGAGNDPYSGGSGWG